MQHLLIPYLQIIAWILLPIIAGIILLRLGFPRSTARHLFLIVLFGCQTPIALMAVWTAKVSAGSWSLPILAIIGWFAATAFGRLTSTPLKHKPKQRGAYVVSMAISNHGYTLTGIVAMVLFGQQGLSQATYAHFLAVPFIVFVAFPLGRFYGNGATNTSLTKVITQSFTDPRSIPLIAMLIGITLNLTNTPRPQICADILPPLVYAGTAICGCAIGFLYRGLHLKKFLRENIISFAYRSTIYPLIYLALATLMTLDKLDTRILLLFGLAPAGLYANLVSDFFDLDTDLSTSIFLISTLLYLLLVLPIFAFMVMG